MIFAKRGRTNYLISFCCPSTNDDWIISFLIWCNVKFEKNLCIVIQLPKYVWKFNKYGRKCQCYYYFPILFAFIAELWILNQKWFLSMPSSHPVRSLWFLLLNKIMKLRVQFLVRISIRSMVSFKKDIHASQTDAHSQSASS